MSIFRVYCNDEAQYFTTTTSNIYDPEPTQCPNNGGHTIDPSLTILVKCARLSLPQGFSWSSGINGESLTTLSSDYVTFIEWIYAGSFSFKPTTISLIAKVTTSSADIRIIDLTNSNNVILSADNVITSSSYDLVTLTPTISNLSDGPARWALQVRRNGLLNLTISIKAVQVWSQ